MVPGEGGALPTIETLPPPPSQTGETPTTEDPNLGEGEEGGSILPIIIIVVVFSIL